MYDATAQVKLQFLEDLANIYYCFEIEAQCGT